MARLGPNETVTGPLLPRSPPEQHRGPGSKASRGRGSRRATSPGDRAAYPERACAEGHGGRGGAGAPPRPEAFGMRSRSPLGCLLAQQRVDLLDPVVGVLGVGVGADLVGPALRAGGAADHGLVG